MVVVPRVSNQHYPYVCVGVSRQMWGSGVFGSHKKRYTHTMVETGEVERYVSHTHTIYIESNNLDQIETKRLSISSFVLLFAGAKPICVFVDD